MEDNNSIKIVINLNDFNEFKTVLKEIRAIKEDNPYMNFQFHIEVAGIN